MSLVFDELSQKLKQMVSDMEVGFDKDSRSGDMARQENVNITSQATVIDDISEVCDKMSGLIQSLEYDKTMLSDEMIACYKQLNASFEATIAIAGCEHLYDAIAVLIDQIRDAIDGRYSFYFGPLADDLKMRQYPKGVFACENDIVSMVSQASSLEKAQAFMNKNANTIHANIQENEEVCVVMHDYKGEYDQDYDGRGNIIILKLKSSHLELEGSTVVFVREDDQQPFAAVEMNLAATIGRMGSAVMGNIVYADKLNKSYLETITSLVRAMEAKDSYTCGHSERVSVLACKLGKSIGLDDHQLQLLEWAGLLHDIGKIGIRDDVLCKPGRLTDEEFEHIKTHSVNSYNVLEPIAALAEVIPAVKHHHEHFDGGGYPDGLADKEIPLLARVLQVVDVWDALTSTRPYRRLMTDEKALSILRKESGTTMDSELVDKFIDMMGL